MGLSIYLTNTSFVCWLFCWSDVVCQKCMLFDSPVWQNQSPSLKEGGTFAYKCGHFSIIPSKMQ